MQRGPFTLLVVLFFIIIAVIGISLFVNAKSECDAKGGVLVKDAVSGMYKCAGEIK